MLPSPREPRFLDSGCPERVALASDDQGQPGFREAALTLRAVILAASEKAKAALAKELGKARREAERANLAVQRELITARPSQTSAAAAGDSAATAAAINLTIDDDDDDVLSTDDAAAELRRVTSGASAGSSDTLYGLPGPDDHEHGAECE